jgi:amino acid transporter
LVMIKIVVVFFVIFAGWFYTKSSNWNAIPVTDRVLPQERVIPDLVKEHLKAEAPGPEKEKKSKHLEKQLAAAYRWEWLQGETKRLQGLGRMTETEAAEIVAAAKKKLEPILPATEAERKLAETFMPKLRAEGEKKAMSHWGLLGKMGLNRWLAPVDDAVRSPFTPYGFSGIMLGASIVFFAFIGFDSISTHAEEAKKPQRDVPIGIITSLLLCTVLYIVVAAVITGMVPYPEININAPIAAAFTDRAKVDQSMALRVSGGLIAAGGLAGMTSVLLVLFLSQARVFMAMARDGLLPGIFGTVHPKFRTPHIATMLTGAVICLVAALTPIEDLAKMVNIGTLMAFVMVCASVMILRIRRPEAKRPFRCPLLFVVAPFGISVNLAMMLFLPPETWWRLLIWLSIGMVIYFTYSCWHSHLAKNLMKEIKTPLVAEEE